MAAAILTQDELKSQLHYNPDTGIFTWLKSSNQIKIGSIAGSHNSNGHLQIKIFGKLTLAHRLAFLYMTGSLPKECVDHINCVRDDNRWCNLREATKQQNTYNNLMRKSNTTGATGVYYCKRDKKFIARCGANGKRHVIGYFDDFESAKIARIEFAKANHGDFYREA